MDKDVNMATTPIASGSSTNSPTDTTKKPKDLKDLDINQFLQIMIAELTNQDPLNPMDNNELVQQIGSIRNIAATDKLSSSLDLVQSGQSLTTASSLIGKNIKALTDENENIEGVVERVSIDVDKDDNNKRTYRVHVDGKDVDLRNVREVLPAA
jgi:flagellar basal-body rod modification protein FlgD